MNLPDPSPVLDLIEAFRHSKTMFTAVSLGVFDRLHESPASAVALAAALNAHPDATERLLDGCAALGFLCKEGGLYSNTPVAEVYLCTGSPNSLYGYIRYSDEALYPMWANLADSVREGRHQWKQTFGLDGPIFSGFFRTESAMRDFLHGMHGFGMLSSPPVVALSTSAGSAAWRTWAGPPGTLRLRPANGIRNCAPWCSTCYRSSRWRARKWRSRRRATKWK
jgi:acetylserotonin N-methyltransferase